MRSLLASLFVLSIGILAALPFRKSSHTDAEAPVLDHSQVASLVSPLEELDAEPSELAGMNFPDVRDTTIDTARSPQPAIDPLPFPSLPKSRRPFSEALVAPKPMVPDHNALSAHDAISITRQSQDWNIDLPLKYVQPQTGLNVEAIVESDFESPIEATRVSNSQAAASDNRLDSPSGMFMRSTGSKTNESIIDQSPQRSQTAEPQAAEPRPRKRFFVYEPAG